MVMVTTTTERTRKSFVFVRRDEGREGGREGKSNVSKA